MSPRHLTDLDEAVDLILAHTDGPLRIGAPLGIGKPHRLLNKGAIQVAKEGRRYLYSPVLSRDAWLAEQSAGLVDRLFGGRVAPLVAHFSEQRKLSSADIAELKRLITELDNGE